VRTKLAFLVLAAIAAFLLIAEHRAHVLPYLPWLVLAACPLMHLFMHRGHGHGGHDDNAKPGGNGTGGTTDTTPARGKDVDHQRSPR
jgi:hypothetical protein